jgi:predicted site-specific integrase-resolvase
MFGADVCQAIGMHPDTFKYRIRNGWYSEVEKAGGKQRISDEYIRDILKTTTDIRNAAIV